MGFIFLSSCNKFERQQEVINFLHKEANIDINTLDNFILFVLQDQICGACTNSVLNFIYSLEHKNSLVIVSDSNKELISQLIQELGEKNIFIDNENRIARYGLRYARDLIVIFNQGNLKYYSFMDESKFDEIRKNFYTLVTSTTNNI